MKKLLLVSLLALVLPAAARSAACGPLTCAPSQFSVGGSLMGYRHGIDSPVTVVDLRNGATRFRLPAGITSGHVLVHQEGAVLQWFDLRTGKQTASVTMKLGGELVGLSQDGSRAVTIGLEGLGVVSTTAQKTVVLPSGHWDFDGLRGDNLFLIKYLGDAAGGGYQVRLLHVRSGKLESKPLKDPHESGTIWGSPFSRLASKDGRYLFTLYVSSNGAAMVHELNLDTAQARCIDLPGTGDYISATTWALAQHGNTLWAAGPGYGWVVGIDIRSRKVTKRFPLDIGYWSRGRGTRSVLSADGSKFALADGESIVVVVGLRRGAVLTQLKARADALGYSPAGRLWALS